MYRCLVGKELLCKMKNEICNKLAAFLDFEDQGEFDRYFSKLPLYLQKALQKGTFDYYLDVRSLEAFSDTPLIVEDSRHFSFYNTFETNPDLRMGVFMVINEFELALPSVIGKIFLPWIPKPPTYEMQPLQGIEGTLWSVDRQISEIIPLLVDATIPVAQKKGLVEIAKKGLLKGEIKDLRASCALLPFPVASSYGLDPIELFVQALTHLELALVSRPEDGQEFVKTLVKKFFSKKEEKSHEARPGIVLEYFCLLSHFSRSAFSDSVVIKQDTRLGLKEMLHQMYARGDWFSLDDLFDWFVLHGYPFDFWNPEVLNKVLFVRGDLLETEFCVLTSGYYDKGFRPKGTLARMLYEKPLFKAYCYLFAVLGLVEIGEKEAPTPLSKNGKNYPVSPYDGLCSMKVTPFGAWCLGFCDERPEVQRQHFETITDSNLLLVTFKGLSLERKLFLTQIGDPMGPERYKINEVSFIRGCSSPLEIHSRIERFKKLIDPNPSDRWLSFFAMIEQRATLFSSGEDVLLYTFPDDPEIRKMFTSEPAFSKILIRAEGNRIVIRKKDQKHFAKLLTEHGYLNIF
jgi:hypothetical protein